MTRLGTTFALWCALGVLAGLIALVTVPRLVGMTPFTILSGSMTPALAVGDVVVDEHIAPADARPGDIVTFPDRTRDGALVTHRVRSIRREGGSVSFVTQGDANSITERWSAPADGRIGRVVLSVPKVGYPLQWARSREGRIGLIVVPALALLLLELGGVLRPRAREAVA